MFSETYSNYSEPVFCPLLHPVFMSCTVMSLHLRWVSSSLGPTAPFPVTCWLWFLISESRYEQVCFTPTNLLFPGIWSSFWKHSWECCHTQIVKLQGCGITDETYVVCFGRHQGWGSANVTAASCVVLLLPAGNSQKHPLFILPENALFFQPLISAHFRFFGAIARQ